VILFESNLRVNDNHLGKFFKIHLDSFEQLMNDLADDVARPRRLMVEIII